jgi:hypothetical protein
MILIKINQQAKQRKTVTFVFLKNKLLKGILTIKKDKTFATALGNIAAKKKN